MPVFPTDSKHTLLLDLWEASLILAAVSLFVALTLVVRRLIYDRVQRRQEKRRATVERAIWGAMSSAVIPTLESLPKIGEEDKPLICSIALNIMRPLRGEEAARVTLLLRAWGLYPYIHHSLAHGSHSQCIRMLTLLGHFNDDISLEILKKWSSSDDSYVQLAALRGLAARNAVSFLPDILQHLIRTKSHNTALLADVLVRFGEMAVSILIPLAQDAQQLEVQLAAIVALGTIGSLDAVPSLINLAFHPKIDIRAQAIVVLGKLGDTRAEYAVFQGLEDAESIVRLQAAQAAGKLQLQGATHVLVRLLNDPSWWVRYRSAEALFRMGSAGQTLLHITSQQSSGAGEIAAQVLAEMESA